MQHDYSQDQQPENSDYYCIAPKFYRRGCLTEGQSDSLTQELLRKYTGSVELVKTCSEPINGKHFQRLRDPSGKQVAPAYDPDFRLVGLCFTTPNEQFPTRSGTVITDFTGHVLYQDLRECPLDQKQIRNEKRLNAALIEDREFR
jgi:hypothetical protein